MARVVQLVKRLASAPGATPVAGIRLRTYDGPADVPRWLCLRQQSGLLERSPAGRCWTGRDFHREFTSRWWWNPEAMWLAEESAWQSQVDPPGGSRVDCNRVVGSVTLGMRGLVGAASPVVHWLLVAPEWRRRGVGRLLLEGLERECLRRGHFELRLETLSSWSSAVAFYEAMGFRRAL